MNPSLFISIWKTSKMMTVLNSIRIGSWSSQQAKNWKRASILKWLTSKINVQIQFNLPCRTSRPQLGNKLETNHKFTTILEKSPKMCKTTNPRRATGQAWLKTSFLESLVTLPATRTNLKVEQNHLCLEIKNLMDWNPTRADHKVTCNLPTWTLRDQRNLILRSSCRKEEIIRIRRPELHSTDIAKKLLCCSRMNHRWYFLQ